LQVGLKFVFSFSEFFLCKEICVRSRLWWVYYVWGLGNSFFSNRESWWILLGETVLYFARSEILGYCSFFLIFAWFLSHIFSYSQCFAGSALSVVWKIWGVLCFGSLNTLHKRVNPNKGSLTQPYLSVDLNLIKCLPSVSRSQQWKTLGKYWSYKVKL
jgi:hypothetical protein